MVYLELFYCDFRRRSSAKSILVLSDAKLVACDCLSRKFQVSLSLMNGSVLGGEDARCTTHPKDSCHVTGQ
jgi:hypothetical protein